MSLQEVVSTESFIFTRHSTSCNNDDAGKLVNKDKEPSLSDRGVVKTIIHSLKYPKNFNANHVYVSSLFRTWCTAVLLYGTKKTEFNLYICPYLKEHHSPALTRGNYPKPLDHMVNKFLKFLNYAFKIEDKEFPTTNPAVTTKIKKLEGFTSFMPDTIKLHFHKVHDTTDTTMDPIIFTKGPDGYTLPEGDCSIKARIDDSGLGQDGFLKENTITRILKQKKSDDEIGFKETGDLQTFMEWFNKDPVLHPKTYPIHVVTHSKTMQEYVKKFKPQTHTQINVITGTNCCLLETSLSALAESKTETSANNNVNDLVKITPGYLKELVATPEALKLDSKATTNIIAAERAELDGAVLGNTNYLCGDSGSVDPLKPCRSKPSFLQRITGKQPDRSSANADDVPTEADKIKQSPKPSFLSIFSRKSQEEVVVPTNGGKRTTRRGKRGKKTQKKRKRKRNKRKTASKK